VTKHPPSITLRRPATRRRGADSLEAATPIQIARALIASGDSSWIFGPPGSGKGIELIVPNITQLKRSSIFVIDPKGEAAAAIPSNISKGKADD
jgi:Type IV secretory system Conjugative DNA transfer